MEIKKPNLFLEKNFMFLLVANFVLLIGLFSFLGLVDKSQNLEKKASEIESSSEVPVLVLSFFPLKDGHLDGDITGVDYSLEEARERTSSLTEEISSSLTQASAYHGYKDILAVPSLSYSVLENKEYLEPIPVSDNEVFGDEEWFRPDYKKILENINICDYVDRRGVKEIWIWGYHHNGVEPFEKVMSMGYKVKEWWNNKDYGDITNFGEEGALPICNSTYSLFNYNYSRGLGEALEDHTHYLESVFGSYVTTGFFWYWFTGGVYTPLPPNLGYYRCGWTHCPPNVMESCPSRQYAWDEEASVLSDCEDWKPDGSGEKTLVNCHTWAGEDCDRHTAGKPNTEGVAFKIWWMQNMPGEGNSLFFEGSKMINWWDYISDFDGATRKYGKTFYSDIPKDFYTSYYRGDQKKEIASNYTTSWSLGNRQKFYVPTSLKNHRIDNITVNLVHDGSNEFVGMISDETGSYPSRQEAVKRLDGSLNVWARFEFDYQVEPGKTYIFWLKKRNQNKAYWFSTSGFSEETTVRNYQVHYEYMGGSPSPVPTISPFLTPTMAPTLTPTLVPTLVPTLTPTPIPTLTSTPTLPPGANCPTSCPTIISASSGAGCFVKLSWEAVENADSYYIYRNSKPTDANPYFKKTTKTEYVWNWLSCNNNSLYSVSAVAPDCLIKECTAVSIKTP